MAKLSGSRLKRVVIDMTPLRAGGENGGARLVPLSMLPHLSAIAPEVEFTLLTKEHNHEPLANLDRPNVRRRLVADSSDVTAMRSQQLADRLANRARELPLRRFRRRMAWPKWMRRGLPGRAGPLADLHADVMLCPFTTPFYYDPSIPLVAVVYDLQHLYYPKFFTPEERAIRQRAIVSACQLADRVICISDYVRQTLLMNSRLAPERVVTVPLGVLQDLQRFTPAESVTTLARLGLQPDRFLLFPSNFWPHKNHRMLLTALGIYRSRRPRSDLKLVCVGTPDEEMNHLREAADDMGLGDWLVLPGFVSNDDLAKLYRGALGLLFPSLYEGFGMPVLEAMALETVVSCSDVTSLPEVAGDAALLFDPRKPAEIADAIERLETEPELRQALVERGRKRVAHFSGGEQLARTYLRIMRELVDREPRQFVDGLHGIHDDGWIGERLVVSHAASNPPRVLELMLRSPTWLPLRHTTVSLSNDGSRKSEEHPIPRGERLLVRKELPGAGGLIELRVEPALAPSTLGLNDDFRVHGCMCEMARLVGPDGSVDLRENALVWLTRR